MKGPTRADGFALVSAIAILVLLAGAGTVMVATSGVQRRTGTLALQGARAYHAARSGIEWGIDQVITLSACPSTTVLSLTEGGLIGFDVNVSCTSSSHTDGGSSFDVYQIISQAEYGTYGDIDYVKRRVRSSVTDAP